jgi:hypothetical protein
MRHESSARGRTVVAAPLRNGIVRQAKRNPLHRGDDIISGGEAVKYAGQMLWLLMGVLVGGLAVAYWLKPTQPVYASNDRYEDYVICTGACTVQPKTPTDGVWLLDYRAGKLLGTVIDRISGKIVGWAEVDLVNEFGIPPRQNVHFIMTTGMINQGQSALYVAEVSSGKFGVYTMNNRPDGQAGIQIKRHDLVMFRAAPKDK